MSRATWYRRLGTGPSAAHETRETTPSAIRISDSSGHTCLTQQAALPESLPPDSPSSPSQADRPRRNRMIRDVPPAENTPDMPSKRKGRETAAQPPAGKRNCSKGTETQASLNQTATELRQWKVFEGGKMSDESKTRLGTLRDRLIGPDGRLQARVQHQAGPAWRRQARSLRPVIGCRLMSEAA
jgi:hypothetical protein